MASPFSIFRDNLKPLMAFLTLVALLSFVVLPAVQMYLQYRQPSGNEEPIATYNGGSFEPSEIYYYQRLLGQSNRFLAAVHEYVINRKGTPRVPNYGPVAFNVMSYGISVNNDPRSVIQTKLNAAEAKKMGIELDDTAIDSWMDLFTDGTLTSTELDGIRLQSSQNSLGKPQLYNLLRTELLSLLYSRIMVSGVATTQTFHVSPLEAWENFLKTEQRATVTAYPVHVDDFLAKAGEPSSETVADLYARGKDRLPAPDGLEPAFRKPYTADIEYVEAVEDDFIASFAAKYSEDQLRAEYERRLAAGEFTMPAVEGAAPLGDATESEGPVGESPAATPASEGSLPAEGAPAEGAPAEDSAPVVTAPPVEPATPATTPSDTPASGEPPSTPSSDTNPPGVPTENPPAGGENPGAQDAPGDGELSDSERRSSVQLVRARLQEEQPPADQPPAEQPPAEQPPAEQPPAEQPPAEQPAAEQPPAEQPPAEQPPAEQPPAEQPPAEQPPAEQPPAEQPPAAPQLKTFEESREEIARSLALSDAQAAMQRAVDEVYMVMRTYSNEMAYYRDRVKIDPKMEVPSRPNLEEIARNLSLRYGKTGMLNYLRAAENPLSRAFSPAGNLLSGLLSASRPEFEPAQGSDRTNPLNQVMYVAWKTESKAEYIPELTEVRGEVVEFAKKQAARKLAEEAAMELAKLANAEPEKSFAELVPEARRNLIQEGVGPFTWMQSFSGFAPFLSEVRQLENVGDDFMRAVFTKNAGQFHVAPNQSQNLYYVVKATDLNPRTDDEELRRRFMQASQGNNPVHLRMAEGEKQEIPRQYYRQFAESIGLKFNEQATE